MYALTYLSVVFFPLRKVEAEESDRAHSPEHPASAQLQRAGTRQQRKLCNIICVSVRHSYYGYVTHTIVVRASQPVQKNKQEKRSKNAQLDLRY